MPAIPEYGQLKVAPDAMPHINAPEAAFGVPHASVDLSGIAKQATDMAQEARRNADQIAVSDADAQLVRAKTAHLWDPNTGAMNARGKEAIPASDASQSGFQKDATDIEGSLANDTQKEAFRRRVNMHYADLGNQLGQHVATQIKQYDVDTTNGHIDAFKNAASKSYQDEPTVQQSVDGTRAAMIDFWRRNGHADGDGVDDFAKNHIADRVSQIRRSVLERFAAAGQDQQASQYFAAHKADFTGADAEHVQELVNTGKTQGDGLRAADLILGIQKADPLPTPGTTQAQGQGEGIVADTTKATAPAPAKTMTEALTRAEAIEDPAARKEATQAIMQHFTHMETAGRLDREAAVARLTPKMEASGGRLNKADPDYQLIRGHPEEWTLLHHSDQLQKPARDPGDPDAFMAAVQLASISPESRKQFMQQTPKDWDGMSTGQKTKLVMIQKQYMAQDEHAATADMKHDLYAAEAQATHYQYQVDATTKSGDVEAGRTARRNHQAALMTVADLKGRMAAHAVRSTSSSVVPSDPAGNVDLRAPGAVRLGSSQPEAPVDHGSPLAGILTALPVVHPTQQMIEGASKNPKYAEYLRSVGVALPKVLVPVVK